MASRAAILRAARAGAPGAGQPTAPPQGSGSPWIGQLPSYTTEPGSGYSHNYGPFLPRPGRTFTEGAFGPMSPILPVPIDTPPEGFPRAQPRRWQPYVGYNLPIGQPGNEGYKLASFATLKTLSETYSILRTCLERRKNEIRALEWDITLTPDAANAYQGDRQAMRDFGERKAKATKFFKRPDPNYLTFESWLHALADQLFVFDTAALYLCPKMGKGLGRGLLGSDLDCLWLIDGTAVRPLMGLHGEVPQPPAPAFQQYEFGVPRADLTTMLAGLDLNGEEGQLCAQLRGDQLLYQPYLVRADSPYGFSLVEQALIPIMTGLRKQAYQLDFFTESSVPRVYISPGDTTMTPNQIRELQDALNATAGDLSWAFKIQVLPPGSKVMPQKEMQIVDDADNWIATEVAMVCDVAPTEIGLIPKVSAAASPFAAREMAQAARSIHERTATKPTLSYLTGLFDFILQVVCGQDDMRFVFEGMEQTQDLAALTDMGIKQVQSGVKTIDEFRDDLHMTRFNLPETREPVVFTQMGPVPLGQAAGQAQEQIQSATAAVGEGHRAVSGSPQRKALPVGTSGQGRMNGPVTQRQARRGGALAPAHATGEGAPGHSGGKPGVMARAASKAADDEAFQDRGEPLRQAAGIDGTAGDAQDVPHGFADGGHRYCEMCGLDAGAEVHRNRRAVLRATGVSKAALSELEALGRHLNKGMPAAEWVPEHIPGHVMALIADDLGKGLSAGYVIRSAQALLGKAQPQQSQQQRQAAQARAQQAQIAARFQAQLTAAFSAALAAAQGLIAAWWAGTLAVTAATLAYLIAEEIRRALLPVLTDLWTAAWEAGAGSAGGTLDANELDAFLAAYGEHWAALISATGADDLLQAIREALAAGNPQAILAALQNLLGDDRAEQIAISETTRAWNAAALLVMKAAGLAYVRWQTRNDSRVCKRCMANQDASPVPIDSLFPSRTKAPPLHPRCRCILLPALPPETPVTGKVLRREVGLNGQETYVEWEPEPGSTGGRVFQPHRSDGIQVPQGGVPGASAGGAPPRWDGSEPEPVLEHVPDPDYGDDAGIGPRPDIGSRPGAYWPAPYMDGYWPAPHGQGMTQPGTSSPGAQNGRPPNGAGKRRRSGDAAVRFLRNAPHAKPGTVYHQLLGNFPPEALAWVRRIRWAGPVDIPLGLIETSGRDTWAARHDHAHVDDIARKLRAGEHVNPIIGVVRAGHNHIRMIDGRHRFTAAEKTGSTVRGYVGYLDNANEKAAYDTYLHQFHSGDDPGNKSFTAGNLGIPGAVSGLTPLTVEGQRQGPYVAGLAVRAADTGRVLMIQRAITDSDPAAGLFEWPGGHAETGETLLSAAVREWREEVGHEVPAGTLTGHWASSNGIYECFVLTVPHETDVPLGEPRTVTNPDGDAHEPPVWWDPDLINGNPAVRPELRADYARFMSALDSTAAKAARTSAEILREYWTHEGHPGPTQYALEEKIRWGEPDDWYRCVDELTPYLGKEGSKGYCNLRHHEVLGYWPAQHARMESEGK